MTKKEWIEYFKSINDREPSDRELKVALQSNYKIDADPKVIKETKLHSVKKSDKEVSKDSSKETSKKESEKPETLFEKVKNIFYYVVGGAIIIGIGHYLIFGEDKSSDYMETPQVKTAIVEILEESYDSDEYDDFKVDKVTLTKDKEKDEDKNTTYSGTAKISYEYNEGGMGFFEDPDWTSSSDTVNIRVTDTKDEGYHTDNFTVEVLD